MQAHLKKQKNAFLPVAVKVLENKREAGLSVLKFNKPKGFSFKTGQFVMLTAYGIGEAAFSLSSSPKSAFLEVTVRDVGNVSHAIHSLKRGDQVGVRGPYGNGFPMELLKKRNLVLVAGGCGIAPLRGVYLNALQKAAGVQVFYGARTPGDLAFKNELDKLSRKKNFKVYYAVDQPSKSWKGLKGFLNEPLKQLAKPGSVVFACGPEVMLQSTVKTLVETGAVKPEEAFFAFERNMQCGFGKCGHCTIRGKFTCADGPVFSLKQAMEGDMFNE